MNSNKVKGFFYSGNAVSGEPDYGLAEVIEYDEIKDCNIGKAMEITKEQYEFALNRIEELLPLVTDETPADDKLAVELTLVSDVVEAYEKEHYPIGKPTIGELIELNS